MGDSGAQSADLKLLIQRLSIYTGTVILVLAVGWGVCGSVRKPGHAGGTLYRIVNVTYGEPFRYPQSYGDTWIATWAGDGHIYTTADDNDGIYSTKPTEDGSCHPGSNLSIVMLKDFSPFQGSFAGGVNRNCMRRGDWNYGGCCEAGGTGYVPPPQGATTTASSWKAVGLICLPDESNKDVLYLSVSLHAMDRTMLQRAYDATIVVSRDHGLSWTPRPLKAEDLTFTGQRFSTPSFIQYGQDDAGTADQADKYLYAVANDGYWNNGNHMYLARLDRAALSKVRSGSAWEFFAGFDSPGNPTWKPGQTHGETAAAAVPILSSESKMSMSTANYVEPLGLYLMFEWDYPQLPNSDTTEWVFYQAPHPWGPWTPVPGGRRVWKPEGYYEPSTVAKWIRIDPAKRELKIFFLTSGDFQRDYDHAIKDHIEHYHDIERNPYYRINLVEATLAVEPSGE